jgi:high affinity Mn2+ porin
VARFSCLLRWHARETAATAWDSQCSCGSFSDTLDNPVLSNPALDPNAPDIAATRKTRSEFGFIGNFEQAVADDLGLFARLSWRNDQTEIMQFTDIDESASFGGVLKGTSWGRPNDKVGLAAMVRNRRGLLFHRPHRLVLAELRLSICRQSWLQ